MNHRRIRTQSLAFLLVVSFLIPGGLVIPLRKVDAQANCVAPIAGALAAGLTLIGVKEGTGVGVAPGDSKVNTVGAGAQFGTFFNNCILKPLAITMARTMVRNISNSIVNWINGGFQGKPGFVTDFKGLVAESADQAIGGFIYGSDLRFLCQPFSVKIRLQLATKYQKKFQEEIRCTLSSITGNVNSFVNNNGGRGWNNWLEITTQPQNNQYGAYLIAESELAGRIQNQLNQVNSMLNRNGGFLDFKVCDARATDRESPEQVQMRIRGAQALIDDYVDSGGTQAEARRLHSANLSTTPRCIEGGRVVTPGSLVNEQAKTVLGGWADQLNLATEIDQIVGALISQFATQMISGAQGFLGLSNSGGYARSNVSVNQALAAGDNTSSPENVGLGEINAAAGSATTFTDDILAPQTVETGVNILEGMSVTPTGPSGVAQSNLQAITDGNIQSIGSVGSAGGALQSLWVRIDIGTSTEVSEVHVWHPDVIDPAESIGTFNIVFSNQESSRTWVSNEYTLREGSPNPTVVRVDRTGRYITLEQRATCSENCQPLRIAEIEVIGRALESSGATGDTPTDAPQTALITFGPTDGEIAYATSTQMDISVPIRTTRSAVLKSLEVNLYSGDRQIGFNSIMSGGITIRQGGFQRTTYPGGSSGARYVNLPLSATGETTVSMNGWMNSNAPLGSYKFELVMKDDTGEILDARTVNFVVQ